jgi:nitroreductase
MVSTSLEYEATAGEDMIERLGARRSPAPDLLTGPGPSDAEIDRLLSIAVRVPDHGRLQPWRIVAIKGAAKDRWIERLMTIAESRDDAPKARVSLRKLAGAPLVVAVISSPIAGHKVPEWEQWLSAGAVGMNLLNAATALGYGGNWLTGWHAYDPEARKLLGVGEHERVAGVVPIGSVAGATADRERPDLAQVVTWLDA